MTALTTEPTFFHEDFDVWGEFEAAADPYTFKALYGECIAKWDDGSVTTNRETRIVVEAPAIGKYVGISFPLPVPAMIEQRIELHAAKLAYSLLLAEREARGEEPQHVRSSRWLDVLRDGSDADKAQVKDEMDACHDSGRRELSEHTGYLMPAMREAFAHSQRFSRRPRRKKAVA